jgi:hypothetical protein
MHGFSLAFTPGNKKLVLGTHRGTVLVWDLSPITGR